MAHIAVLGTFDTKGEEHAFVAAQLRSRGHTPLLIDVGSLEPPTIKPDISREAVAEKGDADLQAIREKQDRGEAVAAMSRAAAKLLPELVADGRIDGVISLGGGGGTAIGTAAMRALPIGFPKVMVTTLASGNTSQYVGLKDVVLFPSVTDVAGLNRISRVIFTRAAGAICGMVESKPESNNDTKPIVVASMFGNTTACVEHARQLLEAEGYEVLVFHATGIGGRTMETIIETGMVAGVLDITTTELADELAGGVLSAGPKRLDMAGQIGVPAIVVPGCLDMVNFDEPDNVPEAFADRLFYQHNPQVTLMRTTVDECRQLGKWMAEKLNAYTSPVSVLLPTRAISIISAPGQDFYDPEADQALFTAIKENINDNIQIMEMDVEINDPLFAERCVHELLALL